MTNGAALQVILRRHTRPPNHLPHFIRPLRGLLGH